MGFFKREQKPEPLSVHIILDQSGSMSSVKADTIGAYNEYVSALPKDANVSLTVFNTNEIRTVDTNRSPSDVERLSDKNFVPAAMTPLYDAIGKVLEEWTPTTKNTALVILTDGQENRSREYTKQSIFKLLDEKQEKDNWLVVYLGSNQDAFAEGGNIGTQFANTITYGANNTRGAMKSALGATLRYASSGNRADAAFTTTERTAAE